MLRNFFTLKVLTSSFSFSKFSNIFFLFMTMNTYDRAETKVRVSFGLLEGLVKEFILQVTLQFL